MEFLIYGILYFWNINQVLCKTADRNSGCLILCLKIDLLPLEPLLS